jgi:hypothetical protein
MDVTALVPSSPRAIRPRIRIPFKQSEKPIDQVQRQRIFQARAIQPALILAVGGDVRARNDNVGRIF